jgi:hypothetical protein
MSFHTFDTLGDTATVPASKVGRYEIVHLRLWAFFIRDNDLIN